MTSYTAGDNPSNGGCFEYKASFLLFILSSPNLYLGSLGSIVGVTKYRTEILPRQSETVTQCRCGSRGGPGPPLDPRF